MTTYATPALRRSVDAVDTASRSLHSISGEITLATVRSASPTPRSALTARAERAAQAALEHREARVARHVVALLRAVVRRCPDDTLARAGRLALRRRGSVRLLLRDDAVALHLQLLSFARAVAVDDARAAAIAASLIADLTFVERGSA